MTQLTVYDTVLMTCLFPVINSTVLAKTSCQLKLSIQLWSTTTYISVICRPIVNEVCLEVFDILYSELWLGYENCNFKVGKTICLCATAIRADQTLVFQFVTTSHTLTKLLTCCS